MMILSNFHSGEKGDFRMTPDRKEIIGDNKVEQYYWAGEIVVYVNNYLTKETFDEAVEKIKKANDTSTINFAPR